MNNKLNDNSKGTNRTSVRTRKEENKRLRRKLKIHRWYSAFITICFIGMTVAFIKEQQISKNKDYAVNKLQSFAKLNTKLRDISIQLQDENNKLVASNKKKDKELKVFRERKELYDKYEYALVSDGKRTDITYDQIKSLQQLLKDKKVNDTDLFLSWIMTESGGKEKCTSSYSTAKGYGQILDGTSKFVYKKVMKKKSNWDSSIAFNGEKNMELMSHYVDYLYINNGNSLLKTIKRYRGRNDVSGYVGRMNEYLKRTGKTVSSISSTIAQENTETKSESDSEDNTSSTEENNTENENN